ncbi:MAG TPA: VCBS repeat-containing protein [Acidimicrobiales bacterium]|nr:VCBS repeat-containing protein [Acidimicrobiales bacterium]
MRTNGRRHGWWGAALVTAALIVLATTTPTTATADDRQGAPTGTLPDGEATTTTEAAPEPTTTSAAGTATAPEESAPPPEAGPNFSSSPAEGETGTRISVAGERCFLPGTSLPGDGVVITLVRHGAVYADTTVDVDEDGRWSGELVVLAGIPAGPYRVKAVCAAPGFDTTDPVTYVRRTFEVTGEGEDAPTEAAVAPSFNGGLEPFPDYDGQSTCSPNEKPGMAAFRRLIQSNHGGGSLGVGRACNIWWSAGGGRFSDDVRRVGGDYRVFAGDFNGDCRDDIFWYGPGSHRDAIWLGTPTRSFRHLDVTVRGDYWPVVGDFNGDRSEDIFWYRSGAASDPVWFGTVYGRFLGRTRQADGHYQPFAGDFDGDGNDDIFWYGPGDRPDSIWRGTSRNGFVSEGASVGYDAVAVPGDYNADDRTDIFWDRRGEASDTIWLGTANGGFLGNPVNMDGSFGIAVAADVDGNDQDDVLFHRDPERRSRLWLY